MLLDKISLAAVGCAGENDGRPALNHLNVTKDNVLATDGHILIEITHGETKAEEFPAIPGVDPLTVFPVLLPVDAVLKVKKQIPNGRASFPILRNALLGVAKDEPGVVLATTDLESVQRTNVRPTEGLTFPKTDMIWPTKKPVYQIGLMLDVLTKAIDTLKAAGVKSVVFTGYDADGNKALRFDAFPNEDRDRRIKGLIMPCRFDHKEGWPQVEKKGGTA